MSSKKRSSPEIWKSLSNKIRRDLLCFIGEKNVASFTEIQERFQMKVGTLYHHLDTLGALLTQDSSKRYLLTEKGKRSYALIEEEIDVSAPSQQLFGALSFLHIIFLRPVYRFIKTDSIRSLGFSLILLIGLTVATYFLSASPIFLFPSFISPDFLAPIFFLASVAITYAICEVFVSLVFKRKNDKLALFQSVIIIQIVLIIPTIILAFVFGYEYPVSFLDLNVWFIIVVFLFQLLCVGLLIEAIIIIKELRFEKAGVLALFVVFIVNALAFVIMNLLEVTI